MSHTFEDVTAVRVPAGVLKVAEGFFLVTGSFFECLSRPTLPEAIDRLSQLQRLYRTFGRRVTPFS